MNAYRWLALPSVLALVVLVASQILTDRIGALQFLWWTPRIALAVPAFTLLMLLLFAAWILRAPVRARRELAAGVGAALLVGVWCTWSDWGFARAPDGDAFRFAHWNACSVNREEAPKAINAIIAFDADAVLLTDPGAAFSGDGAARLEELGYAIHRAGRFAIISRAPVVEATPIYSARGRSLSRFVLATAQGRLAIDAVDLPSETTMPRYISVRNFVAEVEPLRGEAADLVVGDFNITRGSASLSLLAPGAVEAFAASGAGWGGTFPREWPLFAIDQTLVNPGWKALRSRIVDPGLTRHRAQRVDLVSRAIN
ncbi:MAG: hypothetical protein RLZZ238_1569 [Planctomycetota bacterium]